jgi:uncharacterized membrane protein
MKCVICGKEAQYIQSGMSLCEEHFKAQQVEDKEIDLMKIQLYADRVHTFVTIGFSLAFVIYGIIGVFLGLYYQSWSTYNIRGLYVGWIGVIIFSAVALIVILIAAMSYRRQNSKISKMLEAVEKGKRLPRFDELHKFDC